MRRRAVDEPETTSDADDALFQPADPADPADPVDPVEPVGTPTPPAVPTEDVKTNSAAGASRRLQTGRLRRLRRERRTFSMLIGLIVLLVAGFGVGLWVVSNRSAARLREPQEDKAATPETVQAPPAVAPLAEGLPRVLGAAAPVGQWQPADVPYRAEDYDNATITLGIHEERGPLMKLPVACPTGQVYDMATLQLIFVDDQQRVYGRYIARLPLIGAEQTRILVADVGVEAISRLSRLDWSVNFGRTLDGAVLLPRVTAEPCTIDGGPGVQVSVHADRAQPFAQLRCRLVGVDQTGWPIGEWRADLADVSPDAKVVRFGVVVDPAEGAMPVRWQATVVGLP